MAYVPPKTNWTPVDGVSNGDLNRIEGNIVDLNTRVGNNNASINNLDSRVSANTNSINTLNSTRLQTRVNNGTFEYFDGTTWKRLEPVAYSPKLVYVDNANGNDNAAGTGSAPFKTIARAVRSLEETHRVSNQSRQILLVGPWDAAYEEEVYISNFIGGEFQITPLNDTNYAAIRCLRISDCSGVYFQFFNNGRTFDFDLGRGGGSYPFPFSCDRNRGCYMRFSGINFWGGQGAILSIATSGWVEFYNCTIRTYNAPNTYGITCDNSLLLLENLSYPQANNFNVGISATDSIIFGSINFGVTKTQFQRTLNVP